MSNESNIISQTDLSGLKLLRRGKVRDIYEYGDKLLLVATDRISAFDVILPTAIPMKGAVLTQLSQFWFEMMRDIVPNHLIGTDVDKFPEDLQRFREVLRLRSMLSVKAEMFPVECVARGYLAGSGWTEYKESRSVCGIPLPEGLRECDRLPEPIFTPATKAESGHDINISFDKTVKIIGQENATKLRNLTIQIYKRAAEYALPRGIIIADVKFEFGIYDGKIILCDELLTPDFPDSGRAPAIDLESLNPHLTSSTCAITSNRSISIRNLRALNSLPPLSEVRPKSTWRPIACSPAPR